jgi:hypothetical protein
VGFHFESLDGDTSAATPLSGVTLSDGWSRKFSEAVELPNDERLVTLRDAIAWLAKSVPTSEHDGHEVQVAAYYVTEAAENNGPMAFARIVNRTVGGNESLSVINEVAGRQLPWRTFPWQNRARWP